LVLSDGGVQRRGVVLRGIYDWTFLGNYNCLSPGFNFGDNDEISIGDHVDGDWYLIVLRSDTLLDEYKVDLVRLRDEAQFAGSSRWPAPVVGQRQLF